MILSDAARKAIYAFGLALSCAALFVFGHGSPAHSRTSHNPWAPLSIEEIAYKGQLIRTILDTSKSTLTIEHNGNVVGTVQNIAEIKKTDFLPGADLSLAIIWTKSALGGCSSRVLVSIPGTSNRSAELRSNFGGCNKLLHTVRFTNAKSELWAAIAHRADSTNADVAFPRDGRLAIVQVAKPCRIGIIDRNTCLLKYVVAGFDTDEKGMPSSDERVAGHRLVTYHNSATLTGRIEIDGKPYRTFPNVKAFHLEQPVVLNHSAVFSVWMEPMDQSCGYRILLRLLPTGGAEQLLDRVGLCRKKLFTHAVMVPEDNTIAAWAGIMWRDDDPRVEIMSWTGGDIVLNSTLSDGCLSSPNISKECVTPLLPAKLRAITGDDWAYQ